MIAFVPCDIYGHTDNQMMTNKLFCTFVDEQQIDEFVDDIKNHYTIAYNKIFVLYVKSNDEYVCTYNILDAQIDEIPYKNETFCFVRMMMDNTDLSGLLFCDEIPDKQ
jgi:hypothetical protein